MRGNASKLMNLGSCSFHRPLMGIAGTLVSLDQYPSSQRMNWGSRNDDVEEIHSVGTINNVETSYFTQLKKICYLMTTFRCPSDILISSWLFTAQWSTWPGNHLVPSLPCVAELYRILHLDSCTSVSSWSTVPLLSIWSVVIKMFDGHRNVVTIGNIFSVV